MRNGIVVALIFMAAHCIGAVEARAEARLALVIGNARYTHTTKLENPTNDARVVAAALTRQGFDVTEHSDADLRRMRRALQVFFAKVHSAGSDAVVLVYYAGHGVQLRGRNFLIPIDAEIDSEDGVEVDSISTDSVMQMVANAGTRLNIVILDACRNNPFRGFRAQTRGLAQIDAPTGTLVAFSTAPGQVARDGPKGGNSPYTAALVKAVAEPGLKIEDVFKRVRQVVSGATGGAQVPWESSSLVGDFYPAGQAVAAPASGPAARKPPEANGPPKTMMALQDQPLPQAQQSAAAEAWTHAKDSRSISDLEDFVRRFGDSYFGDLAKRRLDELKREAERQQAAALAKQKADAAAEAARKRAQQEAALKTHKATTLTTTTASSRALYEKAYGDLLQQNYAGAERGFDSFLKQFPKDELAPNAQYWLGEAYFVRGQYKQAADAFLRGYQSYSNSGKAPDSLLKLAIVHDRLGNKEGACLSFAELAARFPDAPAHIKSRAETERQRIGCA